MVISAVCNVAQTGRRRPVNILRMTQPPSPPTPVPVTLEAVALRSVTCPLCHTPSSLTHAAVEAGGEWQCIRCGQHWDTTRLAALANYALWLVEHDRLDGAQDASAVSTWDDEGGTRKRSDAVVVH